MALFQTDYGYFCDDGKEYIITRPDTPMPWINVISNGDYGMTLSQAGSGYSWRTHASLNRLTRWEQDLIRDEWGKYLYLRDSASGAIWSVSRQPCGEALEDYRVRHGMGYSVIEGCREGIEHQVTYTVPLDDPCELWIVRLHNHDTQTRRIQLYSHFEWCLGAAPDWHREFHRTFIETKYVASHNALLATKVLWDLPGDTKAHWNREWAYAGFHSVSPSPAGFNADKYAFLGRHGTLATPYALQNGLLPGKVGRWHDPVGNLSVDVELAPDTTVELVFVLGTADNTEHALQLADWYRDPQAAQTALEKVQRFWTELTNELVIETPDPAFNVMGNGWLQYQAIAGRLWGRSAYYQLGGAFGFRDQLQDSLVWLLLGRSEQTLKQIKLHAAHQYHDGVVLHWWHPLAESGLRSNYSDDLLWLPFVVLHYLHETGDMSCLDEIIPFFDDGSASLLEHCRRAFEVALSRYSAGGLPLILAGDWNDGLNAVGIERRGESTWMAHFLHYLLVAWADLDILDNTTQKRFQTEADALRIAVNEYCWDGGWYIRATTDAGAVLGSSRCAEGQVFLNAQTWAVLSGIAPTERAQQAMVAVRERLYQSYGPLLLAPAYAHPDSTIGYLTRYAPGARENGGVYVHAACWAVLAERQIAGADDAYQLWRSFCPVVRGSEPTAYMAEPYVMPGNVDGPLADLPGRGGWTWYTGAAAWCLRAMVEGVLGITADLRGLRIEADLPQSWSTFRMQRRFRGATYVITVRRAINTESSGCWVDGALWDRKYLPLADAGTTVQVDVVIA